MANVYWEIRKGLSKRKMYCGSLLKFPFPKRTKYRKPLLKGFDRRYPRNRWGIGWHKYENRHR